MRNTTSIFLLLLSSLYLAAASMKASKAEHNGTTTLGEQPLSLRNNTVDILCAMIESKNASYRHEHVDLIDGELYWWNID